MHSYCVAIEIEVSQVETDLKYMNKRIGASACSSKGDRMCKFGIGG